MCNAGQMHHIPGHMHQVQLTFCCHWLLLIPSPRILNFLQHFQCKNSAALRSRLVAVPLWLNALNVSKGHLPSIRILLVAEILRDLASVGASTKGLLQSREDFEDS